MRNSFKLVALLALVAAITAPVAARVSAPVVAGPVLASIGPLAFNADGVLFAADKQAATIFALDLGAQASSATAGTADVPAITDRIAAMLGTAASEIAITDLAVHPKSHNTFLSVMRGMGTDAKPALLRVDGAGKIDLVSLDAVKFTSVALPNPAAVSTSPRGGRTQSVTDMAFSNGHLFVAGLSNEEFASKLWSVAYPFASADRGTSVEIYHGNHGRLETASPVMAFLPLSINNQPNLIASYTCTPLVKFPVSSLKPGDKIMGTTIAEFGAGNQPLDMIAYQKDGRQFLLMSNSVRGVMKIPTAGFRHRGRDHGARRWHGRNQVRDDHGAHRRGAARPARRTAVRDDREVGGRRPESHGRRAAVGQVAATGREGDGQKAEVLNERDAAIDLSGRLDGRFLTRSTLLPFALCLLPLFLACRRCSAPASSTDRHRPRVLIPPPAIPSFASPGFRPASYLPCAAPSLTDQAWRDLLRVSVTGAGEIAVAGRYEATTAGVEFRPAFPLDPGRAYAVRFDAARLPTPRSSGLIETLVSVPRAAPSAPTVVTAIYPRPIVGRPTSCASTSTSPRRCRGRAASGSCTCWTRMARKCRTRCCTRPTSTSGTRITPGTRCSSIPAASNAASCRTGRWAARS